jgi:hypothetical protein
MAKAEALAAMQPADGAKRRKKDEVGAVGMEEAGADAIESAT